MAKSIEPTPQPELAAMIGRHAAAGDWPGGVYAVGPAEESPRWLGCAGSLARVPEIEPASATALYDLASLTKVLATTAIALALADRGDLDLDAPADEWLPELRGYAGSTPSIVDLLSHRAGFPAWARLAPPNHDRSDLMATICATTPGPRRVALYGDLGLICAGIALERLAKESLGALLARHVTRPLGIAEHELCFGPIAAEQLWRVAPTESGRVKEAELIAQLDDRAVPPQTQFATPLRGVAHDGNAAAMGGIAGHAGLFGTASAVFRVAAAFARGDGLFSQAARERVWTPLASGGDDVRGLGFQLGSAPRAPAGAFGPDSFGHTGFTGTSMWIGRQTGWIAVLLTNRVHPIWRESPVQQWRREFHDLAVTRSIVDSI